MKITVLGTLGNNIRYPVSTNIAHGGVSPIDIADVAYA
ncbi:hypothetical protein DFQ01_101509 [Paenibacillus cellulosilyticus]|uniref:Uncharacterized protein n=1 Tax=Paenibacillus cellulosilyticus TaxID=375489 RepID=A0A2V2Z0H3_9BACL|nr:hypothetical protein DFQ01_101509 [Paenibacillus cellulosilyticus]